MDRDFIDHFQHLNHLQALGRRVPRPLVRDHQDAFHKYSEEEFISRYRLNKRCTLDLLESIKNDLPVHHNNKGLPIPPHLQLIAALRYMASGNFQLAMGDCTDISQSSVSRCTSMMAQKIAGLAPLHIKFPDPANEEAMMSQFAVTAGMPGVIGCIDGTHVPIKNPGGNDAELYRCRKGFFSLNVMGVCDASLKFSNIVVNWPGSAHDSRIFNESLLCERLRTGLYKGFLLGDSAYACRSYLLTPVLNPRPGKQTNYNASHIRTRNSIERAFGVLKRRWAVLSIPMRTKLDNTKHIIMACAVLHNIAINYKINLDLPDVQLDPQVYPDLRPQVVQEDNARRNFIIDNFF